MIGVSILAIAATGVVTLWWDDLRGLFGGREDKQVVVPTTPPPTPPGPAQGPF